MLTAVRAMAHRVAHDLAHMRHARGSDPTRTPERAGRADRRGARARARRRPGGGRARPRPAAGAERGGRRRRRRLRPDGDRRRRGRRAARRASRPSSRTSAPPRASTRPQHESSTLPLLHQLRRHRRRPRRPGVRRAARGARRLACSSSATRRRCASTSTPTSPTRAVALFAEPARSRASTSPTCASRSPSATRGSPHAAVRGAARVVAVATGDGHARLYEELGAHVVDGGPTMNPSTYELLAAIHAAAGRRGGGAAEQPERDHGRRARGRAVGEARRAWCRRARQQEGLAALLAFDPRATSRRTPTRVADALAACSQSAASRRPRATTPRAASRAGDAVGYVGDELVAWGEPAATLRATLAAVADGAELVTCIAGDGAPLDARPSRRRSPTASSSSYHDGGQPAWWWLLCAE